jgi:hypothetical protein
MVKIERGIEKHFIVFFKDQPEINIYIQEVTIDLSVKWLLSLHVGTRLIVIKFDRPVRLRKKNVTRTWLFSRLPEYEIFLKLVRAIKKFNPGYQLLNT